MGIFGLCLSLICLLQISHESSLDFCTERRGIPPDFRQINGLWNLKAIASFAVRTVLNEITYSYTIISVTDKEANVTGFYNPMAGIDGGPIGVQRVYNEKETLTYSYKARKGVVGTLTFIQLHPDSLTIHQKENDEPKLSALYIRSTLLPESELEYFKQRSKCKKLSHFKEFNNTINYAQNCHGLFEDSKFLEEIEDHFTSWHLVAKSSSSVDHHYDVKILYTARLEISRKQGEYTLKEIITAPNDTILLELKYETRPGPDGLKGLTFKTEKDLLLLGIQNEAGKTLYLASRTPTAKQFAINKFKTQSVCMETKYNYFIPGSREKDDDVCVEKLEQLVPINFQESIGKWILTVSAHESTQTALSDFLSSHGITEIGITDDKLHLFHISIHQGTVTTLEKDNIEVEENTGHILYKDTPSGTRTPMHRVSPNCIMFSPDLPVGMLYLNCRSNQVPSVGDIRKFVDYANCRKYNNIVIRQHSSFLCSDLPVEVENLDVKKIAGTMKLVAVAANIPQYEVLLPPEIQFIVNNDEVTITDGSWNSTAVKIRNRRLQYAKGGESVMEMRFHEPIGDSILTWVGNTEERKVFLVLFSKTGRVKSADIERFKQFASCLSIPVIFTKE